jgi:hypothetical protein
MNKAWKPFILIRGACKSCWWRTNQNVGCRFR